MKLPDGLAASVPPFAIGAVALLAVYSPAAGATAALLVGCVAAYRVSIWLAACAAAWAVAFLAVLVLPGPYDSWAGAAVVPVLACYAACFLGAWAATRLFCARSDKPGLHRRSARWALPRGPAGGPALRWPRDRVLLLFLLGTLAAAVLAAFLRFGTTVPPLFADNPDVARSLLAGRASIYAGLLSEAWTVGMSVSLLRLLAGAKQRRWIFGVLTLVFTVGAALGASKNSVLIGIVPGLIAALSVRRTGRQLSPRTRRKLVFGIVGIGVLAVGAAVFLGGQRTLAGQGDFENQFRAQYGNNALASSVGSLDLSLSASVETFGRLWAQHENQDPAYGGYSLMFSGSPGHALLGARSEGEFYRQTSQLSEPFFMNTATAVAIPLMDFGPVGAAFYLALLGVGVGLAEWKLERSRSPAGQLGTAFLVYFSAFGIYEFYPAVQPFWMSLAPALFCLHLVVRRDTNKGTVL
ncbi:hypothetical protein Lfu02_64740 [Longispora fulva]|uniref:Uncharacterized protein n=1 Tax=Longispora fulva TaxID=619741 RepID=A0A8J7KQS2_9ACTN|nr:O-antigen polymerase [Longispora fulva]MBG6137742.1 hypothetical protein [Longispora fulva]GIG62102.1 hypothetical protein Lfu02_64740 [Longispora fulva]